MTPLTTLLLALILPVAQTAEPGPRDVVQAAERAVSDDSVMVVRARWSAALERDSTDRVAHLGLGTVARLTYEFPAAEGHFRRLLSPGKPGDGWTVQARLGLSRVALAQGDYRRTDSLMNDAIAEARRLGDREGEMDALIGLSNTRSASGGMEAALAVLDTLRALLPPGDSPERVQYLCRLGLYSAVASKPDAPSLTGQGTAMAERLGERRLTGHCLEAHAMTHSLLGRGDSVLAIMDRAERLLRLTSDHASLARLMSRRSDELQFRGRLGEAKIALRQLLTEAEISRNRERYAFAYGGLGMLALRLSDLPTAMDHFERAAALYDSLGHGAGAAIARSNRAWGLLLGDDMPAARTALLGVLEEALKSGDLEDEMIARQQLARVAMRQGDWVEASRQLDAAHASARVKGRGEEARGHLAYDRARVALGRGDLAAAERLFSGYLAGIDPENHLHRHLTSMRLAEVWARGGDLNRAERQITTASEELETWRGALRDDELRRFAFGATALGEHDPQAPVARVLAALARAGRTDAAFALAEQRRARALTDRLNQADALREGGVGSARAHRVSSVTASELAAALPDDSTALLEYVAGSEGAPTTLFVVTRSGARAHILPPADSLTAPIRRLVAMLESGGDPASLARALGTALIAPAAEALPHAVTRIVVVPDGPLHRVPFDILRLPDGRTVVERWAVGLAPSAGVALGLWRNRDTRRLADTVRLLALGDPEFSGEQATAATRDARIYRSAFASEGGLARLSGSGDEARGVARYSPGPAEVRLRGRASEQWLKQAPLAQYRVIHLATHALVDETSLARTALALAPGAGEDGFLSPADLAALRLDADLVVLSACRTAGGVTVVGEGMEGLTAPLMAAGARAVVATQWRIGDRSTVRLVDDFYGGLAKGLPVADALRSAKLLAIGRGAPPSDWAGFTVVGDPLTRVRLATPPPRRKWETLAVAGAGAVLLVLGIYLVSRRGRRPERGMPGAPSALTHH